jgi:hypothetical protein
MIAHCVFNVPKNVRLGNSFASEFIDAHVGSKGDKSYETLGRQEIQSLRQRISKLCQFFLSAAAVNDEQKSGWTLQWDAL